MRGLKIALIAALFTTFPAIASAETLTRIVSTSFSGSNVPVGFAPFDHTLGTLTSVEVTISGVASASILTQPNFDGLGNPLPLPFQVFMDQNFSGIPSHAFFTFDNPATLMFTGVGSGVGEVEPVTAAFNYGFHFNSTTDLIGFTAISGAPGVGLVLGTLDGFTDTFSPAMSEFMTILPKTVIGGSVISASAVGSIVVQYDYTPAAVAAVPEPNALLLIASGLVGLISLATKVRSS